MVDDRIPIRLKITLEFGQEITRGVVHVSHLDQFE